MSILLRPFGFIVNFSKEKPMELNRIDIIG
jgi:hypothetical protein